MNACCEWFNQMLNNRGQKGISIIAVNDVEVGVRSFYLQARAVDHSNPKLYDGRPLSRDEKYTSMATMVRTPLDFCPRCGKNLKKLINKDIKEFDLLAADSEHLARW